MPEISTEAHAGIYNFETSCIQPLCPEVVLSEKFAAIAVDFAKFIHSTQFPCIGARMVSGDKGTFALTEGTGPLTDPETARQLWQDLIHLSSYTRPWEIPEADHLKYVATAAVFPRAQYDDEIALAKDVLTLLKNMHVYDSECYPTPIGFSREISSPDFTMCIGGHPYFAGVFHPVRERSARQYPHVVIAFNSHYTIDHLKKHGLNEKMQQIMRENMRSLFGFVHPDLIDHGAASEIFQYFLVKEENRERLQEAIAEVFGLPSDSPILAPPHKYREQAQMIQTEKRRTPFSRTERA